MRILKLVYIIYYIYICQYWNSNQRSSFPTVLLSCVTGFG